MFTLKGNILVVELPQGHTQEFLVKEGQREIGELITQGLLFGLNLQINGRVTTGMALMLGHKLSHVCKTVSIFDPKENGYLTCISH